MNLHEFINRRHQCPICDTELITQFISNRKQKIKMIDDRFVAIFVMKAMSVNQPDYEVGYSFNLYDNTFRVEFYSEWNHHEIVPMHMIDKFKEFHKNLGTCKFLRRCTFCNRYSLSSISFSLDFKTGSIIIDTGKEMTVAYESFGLTIPSEDGYKIMHLSNFYVTEGLSRIIWFRAKDESDARLDRPLSNNKSEVTLSLIPFVSKEETTRRINNLITFV